MHPYPCRRCVTDDAPTYVALAVAAYPPSHSPCRRRCRLPAVAFTSPLLLPPTAQLIVSRQCTSAPPLLLPSQPICSLTHRLRIQEAAAIAAAHAANFLPLTYVVAIIPAAIADNLLPPAHPHRRRCRIYVSAVITAYRSANFFLPTPPHRFYHPIYLRPPQNQSKCILLPPNAQFHQKYTKKIALNAPEHTAVVYLHLPVSSNAIGVLKCTLFVSLITQVSHCIFLFLSIM